MPRLSPPTRARSAAPRALRSVPPRRSVAPLPALPAPSAICHSCHLMPAGTMEIFSLLLVLVFSLSAVLSTTVYALNLQKAKVAQLEQQVGLAP